MTLARASAVLAFVLIHTGTVAAQTCAQRRLPDGSYTMDCPSQIPQAPASGFSQAPARSFQPRSNIPNMPIGTGMPPGVSNSQAPASPMGVPRLPMPGMGIPNIPNPPMPSYAFVCIIPNLGSCQISHHTPLPSGGNCNCLDNKSGNYFIGYIQ
jgi:hypothetical protein